MLRMSKLTDYGTMVLAQLAATNGSMTSASQVADATHIAAPTVSKLLKSLARAGLVVSERGALGGYALARAADSITAAEIIDALEGPVSITTCSATDGHCDLEPFCRVGHAWQRINHNIRAALGQITLADLQSGAIPPAATMLPGPRKPTAAATH